MTDLTVLGILVAHLVGEVLLQPESMSATKTAKVKEAVIAQAFHQALWLGAMLLIVGWPGLTTAGLLLFFHILVDATGLGAYWADSARLPSVGKASSEMIQSLQGGSGPGYMTLLGANGVVGEKAVHHTLHLAAIYAAYKLGPLIGSIQISVA
jgi:hypothetical protein